MFRMRFILPSCNVFITIVTIISAIELSGGSHVLIIHDVGTKSHLIQLFPVVEGLLENGHQVTGVFFSSSKIVHPNFTEVLVPNNFDKIMGDVSKLYMEKGGQSMFNLKLYQFVYDKLIELMDEYAVTSIKNEVAIKSHVYNTFCYSYSSI